MSWSNVQIAAASSFLVAFAICSYSLGTSHAVNFYTATQVQTTPAVVTLSGQTLRHATRVSSSFTAGPVEEVPATASLGTQAPHAFTGVIVLGAALTAAMAYVWNKVSTKSQSPNDISRVGMEWNAAAIAVEEDYPGPGNPDEEYQVTCVWEGKEHVLKIKGDESILVACEEAGLQVPYLCRNGVCLDCTAKVVEGIEHARKDSQCHNSENIRNGYVCTCSTYVGGNGMKLLMGMQEEAYKAQFGKFEEEEREREKRKKSFLGGLGATQ